MHFSITCSIVLSHNSKKNERRREKKTRVGRTEGWLYNAQRAPWHNRLEACQPARILPFSFPLRPEVWGGSGRLGMTGRSGSEELGGRKGGGENKQGPNNSTGEKGKKRSRRREVGEEGGSRTPNHAPPPLLHFATRSVPSSLCTRSGLQGDGRRTISERQCHSGQRT